MAQKIDFEAIATPIIQAFISDLLDTIRAFDETMLKEWLRANYPEISGID